MRILFVIGSLGGGGSERQLIGILRALDRRRFAPSLYLSIRSGELLDQLPADVPVFSYSDLPQSSRIYWPGRTHQAQVAHLAGVMRKDRGESFDVVYDRTPHATLIAAPAARRAAIPRVSTVVLDPSRDVAENLGRFSGLKRRLLTGYYQRAAQVIANSHSLAQEVTRYYHLQAKPVQTIENGFDFELLDGLATQAVPHPISHLSNNIVTVGRLQPQKGTQQLVEAVSLLVKKPQHSQLVCWIIGQGPEEPAIKGMIDRLGIASHIKLTGYLANPLPIVRQCQLFVLPSKYEGMPNALVEAMSLGVPVVASDCPHGPREILTGGEFGLLLPQSASVHTLAEAIDDRLCNAEHARQVARLAQLSVRQRYSMESSVCKLETLFSSLRGGSLLDCQPFLE
jgi:glycosyltransferase involved in cell wall biosynthesis